MVKCADCFHEESNHDGIVCSGSIECRCEKFKPPYLAFFAQRIDEEKLKRKTIKERCEFILEQIPQTRNAGEKSFAKIYWEIWYGFKIRSNNPQSLDKKTWDRLPNADTINREKRRCKQFNDDLKTYSKEVLFHQTAIYQALMEMAIE